FAEALPGDPAQATSGTWGWVNGYADDDPDYAAFRVASLRYWPEMIARIDGLSATAEGAFIWDLDEDALPASIDQHRGWGHDVAMVDGDAMRPALPHLQTLPGQAGFGLHDLAIEGRTAARAILEASDAAIHQTKVSRLIVAENRITGIETETGAFEADEIILTAGMGTPDLLAGVDVDFTMRSSLGLLAYTEPLPRLLDHPVAGVDFHARQDKDGRLVIGGAFTATADDDPDPAASAEKLVQAMAARLNYEGAIRLDHFTLGKRPLPMDGRPKIGRVRTRDGETLAGLYIAVMHSGMTNAPLAGRLGVEEVMTGKRHPLLSPYDPQGHDAKAKPANARGPKAKGKS
ncbi:MAG: NAD(P)/FAD-dependent oxidoreductase, partial [Candidatus Puniceispirillales bacterium]